MGGGGSKMNTSFVDISHFELERIIGQGGFGKVYACTKKSDTKLKDKVRCFIDAQARGLTNLPDTPALTPDTLNSHPPSLAIHVGQVVCHQEAREGLHPKVQDGSGERLHRAGERAGPPAR